MPNSDEITKIGPPRHLRSHPKIVKVLDYVDDKRLPDCRAIPGKPKKSYRSKAKANDQRLRVKSLLGKAMTVYQCRACGNWHLATKKSPPAPA